jgi:hypothetical protein
LKEDESMPRTAKDPASNNGESEEKDEEAVEFDEDYSPKRGFTFIFASAGFSLFLLAVLAALRPYLIPKIAGVEYYQNILYGLYNTFSLTYTVTANLLNVYSHIFDLSYAIITTCVAALVAALLYFSWSGEKKPFPDSSLIGLSVSIISFFIQNEAFSLFINILGFSIRYTFDWVGILILLALGPLSSYLGSKLSK